MNINASRMSKRVSDQHIANTKKWRTDHILLTNNKVPFVLGLHLHNKQRSYSPIDCNHLVRFQLKFHT